MNEHRTEPKIVGMDAWEWSGPDWLVPDCQHVTITGAKGVGAVGLYFMPPGAKTNVFCMDDADDGKANKLNLKAGNLGHWVKGWKYSVKNTGKVPGTFFWGISSPPKGTKTRNYTGAGARHAWE